MKGKRVTPEECVKIFNATSINLNLHSSVQADELVTFGDFINPRTFELAACQAFQLVDKRSLLPEAFSRDELVTFSSMDELIEKIDHFSNNPDECRTYVENARRRVLSEHTYVDRMRALIDFTSNCIPNWPKQKSQKTTLDLIPPELAKDIHNLLGKLGLPEDVSFDDLVWAVRQQQGKLTELDTAILFLDEWQKLYNRRP